MIAKVCMSLDEDIYKAANEKWRSATVFRKPLLDEAELLLTKDILSIEDMSETALPTSTSDSPSPDPGRESSTMWHPRCAQLVARIPSKRDHWGSEIRDPLRGHDNAHDGTSLVPSSWRRAPKQSSMLDSPEIMESWSGPEACCETFCRKECWMAASSCHRAAPCHQQSFLQRW